MKRHIKGLINEIDLWVSEGIIAPEQGQAIKKRYPAPSEGRAWSRIIFFSIGAILFGLGVILIFAYNWQRMHKLIKLAVIFAAIIGAHGAGFWLRRQNSPHQTAGEGLHLLGTMLFGAGIWLPLLGTFLVAAGASALNQYWERQSDASMRRTSSVMSTASTRMPR